MFQIEDLVVNLVNEYFAQNFSEVESMQGILIEFRCMYAVRVVYIQSLNITEILYVWSACY